MARKYFEKGSLLNNKKLESCVIQELCRNGELLANWLVGKSDTATKASRARADDIPNCRDCCPVSQG